MPFMTGAVLSQTKTTMIVCTVFLGIIAAINGDMFLSLANLFKRRSDADVLAALSTLFVLGYSIFGIINGEIITDLCLLCGASLTVRAIGKFQKYSYLLSNLKQITKKSPKKAVRLLNDPTITYAMAKNSIEGDTLIATPQQTERIDDYIKYSTYGTFLNGKLPIIIIVSLLLSALTLLAATKNFGNIFDGMYAAAAVQCFASMPAVFLIDNLPLYKAAKKLNRQGAMISGKAGAEHIELANAIVLNSDDLFPAGTVTLHDMRVLSENNMSDTILRAASLTRELSSPLFNVFREIAGDENMQNLPTSDTVKYEERMGISGWVDNQLLFIGNRTIMEAHGITVPDIETDRKVLRSGYFPVYVASNDTAVALLMVQYSVSPTVSKELHNLTKIGVTLLINNTDPNLSNEMICDYLGLYEDSVMVMSAAGCNMYKNTSTPVESCSTPAVFRGKPITLAKILNCANRIRRSNTALTVMYVLTAVLGILTFAYTSFAANDTLMGGATILLYAVASTILTLITYLTQKP
jgi:Cu+-exporting ATPase